MTLDSENTAAISVMALARIDAVCLEFERAWRKGTPPNIQDFIDGFDPGLRCALVTELVLLDIDYRSRTGQQPQASEYFTHLPDSRSTIEKVFAHHQAGRQGDKPQTGGCLPSFEPTTHQGPPQQLGRYRIVKQLGVGGFGSVYLALDDELQRKVAVKFPHWSQQSVHVDSSCFLKEARILATLSHPAIVPVYDIGHLPEDLRVCYVVSQLMDGGDLSEYLANHQPAREETVRIVIRLSEGLHYAHSQGFVHRDIKPSNILRDANGEVYLSDFGLAIRETALSDAVGMAGTPAYMSPEQSRGDWPLVDARTDIYSLGVILYEMLTAARPFRASDVADLLAQIQQEKPRPLRELNPSVPEGLERICLKALAKRPADRFGTARDLADELRGWQLATTLGDTAKHSPQLMPRFVIAGLLAATFLAVIAWLLFRNDGTMVSSPIESIAVLPFRTLNMVAEEKYLGLAISDALITRLSNIRQLKVRPTGSIRHYADSAVDPLVCGNELQVDAVLEGTIQLDVESTRATIRLLRVADGKTLWAGTFDEASRDLFAVQDSISEKVTQILALELSSEERTRFNRRNTESPAALEAYLKGRYYWNQRGSDGVAQAITFFKQAIEHDPLYALAYAGLAESYVLMNLYSYDQNQAALPMGKAAAEQALRLDPGLTEAIATLAYVKLYYDYDWEGAEQEFRHAIQLNPNYATAHQWYGEYLFFRKRFEESVIEIRLAGELDPLSSIIRSIRGSPFLFQRDYERARQEYLNALDLHPQSGVAIHGLATCFEQQQMFADAVETYERMHLPPERTSPAGQAGLAYVYAIAGQETKARSILKDLVSLRNEQRISAYLIATVYAGLGESEVALDWLQTAYEERNDRIVWVEVDPKLDSLRKTPRFQEFLQSIGL